MKKVSMNCLNFFNVLEESVVGPRPHMVSVTEMYALKIDKFMMRHFIKPGITGLAQTKGLW
jgi:putative colanic acid biosynthesis UDP-glucose lipid carrier transferase